MSNRFEGTGNLGRKPELRTVKVNGENRQVCDLWIYFDRPIKGDDGKYSENGGFFLACNVWDKRAEKAFKLFTKGIRLHVIGHLNMDTWEDSNQEKQSQLRLNASKVFIDPICLESVVRINNGDTGSHPEGESKESELDELEEAL